MNAILNIGRKSYVNGVPVDEVRDLIAAVSKRPSAGMTRWRVANTWRGRFRSCSQVAGFTVGGQTQPRPFAIETDQPSELGGTDNFANPQEYLLAALNACMTASFATLCALHGLEIYRLEVVTEGDLDLRGFLGLDPLVSPGYDGLATTVRIKGPAPREDYERIFHEMLATSPNVHNITRPIPINPTLVVA